MPDPFDVRTGTDPGTLLFAVDSAGNVTVVGTLTVLGTILPGAIVPTGPINSTDAFNSTRAILGDNSFTARALGDSFARFTVGSDGKVQWGPGNGAPDTNLYRAGAALLATDSSFAVETAGAGLRVKEGANAKQGTAVLVAGAVTVADTAVTANSRIFLTSQVDGGAPGFLRVSARVAGTSFTVTSSSGTDTSTVAYEIFEPA
jgi:hypothetical protein